MGSSGSGALWFSSSTFLKPETTDLRPGRPCERLAARGSSARRFDDGEMEEPTPHSVAALKRALETEIKAEAEMFLA